MRVVARALPPSYVFEGLRAVLFGIQQEGIRNDTQTCRADIEDDGRLEHGRPIIAERFKFIAEEDDLFARYPE